MGVVHSKVSLVTLNGVDLSTFSNNISFNRSADSHDVTTFGKASHVFAGGLGTGEATLSGFYDDTVTGPRATIEPLIGTVVVLTYKAEGTGSGKPLDTVNVLVTAYNETSAVADMVMWEATLQLSDAVATTAQ